MDRHLLGFIYICYTEAKLIHLLVHAPVAAATTVNLAGRYSFILILSIFPERIIKAISISCLLHMIQSVQSVNQCSSWSSYMTKKVLRFLASREALLNAIMI